MQTLQYTNRDFTSVFNNIKEILTTLEPRAEVSFDSANVESIIAKIVAGCFDSLSYNQDANILETFPSTSRDARAIFDLVSIVGYTPKTARSSKMYLTLWNPSFIEPVKYPPFTSLQVDGKTFYSPDTFSCAQGVITNAEFYQGTLTAPDMRSEITSTDNFIDSYYPNLSASTIRQDLFQLPTSHTSIDSRTIRIYTPDGTQLTYVENPYLVYTTKSSFSILPTVNTTGYSLIFSKDVSSGAVADNYYYFYLQSDGLDIGNNLTIDFTNFNKDSVPNFSYNYTQEASKAPETANEARQSIAYEFGWRDTPKAIITKYDAERAVLQNNSFVAAVDVRDGNDFSKASSDLFDVHIFVKLTEDAEVKLDSGSALAYRNRIQTHLNKFKALPLNYSIHINDVKLSEDEIVTEMYYWYPNVTVYLKEQVNSQDASAVLTEIYNALFERYEYKNVDFNQVPRIVDVIETIQNASDVILYLDIDGIHYLNSSLEEVNKEEITCSYTDSVNINDTGEYEIDLNTLNGTRNIEYHTVKIVDSNNVTIGFDNGDGTIMSENSYITEYGTVDYATGKLKFKLNMTPPGNVMYVYYKQETPCYCKFINSSFNNIKIALESIKE